MIDSRLEMCVKHCHIHTVASPIAWATLTVVHFVYVKCEGEGHRFTVERGNPQEPENILAIRACCDVK